MLRENAKILWVAKHGRGEFDGVPPPQSAGGQRSRRLRRCAHRQRWPCAVTCWPWAAAIRCARSIGYLTRRDVAGRVKQTVGFDDGARFRDAGHPPRHPVHRAGRAVRLRRRARATSSLSAMTARKPAPSHSRGCSTVRFLLPGCRQQGRTHRHLGHQLARCIRRASAVPDATPRCLA